MNPASSIETWAASGDKGKSQYVVSKSPFQYFSSSICLISTDVCKDKPYCK